MASVLFVTWDGGGNVAPLLLLATELHRRGRVVRVMGHTPQREVFEAAGLEFEAYRTARPWSVVAARSGVRADLAYAAVFADRGMGRDVVESLRSEPAERIVVDGLLIGVLDALARENIDYTILVHTLRAVMYRALVSGSLGLVLRSRGLRPRRLYERAEQQLVVTEPSLDPGADDLQPPIVYTGPLFGDVHRAATDATPPRVLVSLSTTYVSGQQHLLQRIIDALAELPVIAVVTAGPAVDVERLRPSANTELHAVAPHAELMATTSLVVGHGGHATTMLALAHGIPILVMPTNLSFDQPFIGRVIAERGLGMTLPASASVQQIRDAAHAIHSDPLFRIRAMNIGAQLRARDAVSHAATLLEAGVGKTRE